MAANQPPQFKILDTNFCFNLVADDCEHLQFRPWINFLSGQSIVQDVDLNEQAIGAFYLSAENRSAKSLNSYQTLMFRVGQREYIVTEDDVNAILKFSIGNTDFAPEPTTAELVTFFQFINYQNLPQDMKDLAHNHLPNQWRFFFNVISHVFAPKTHGFHGITPFLQKIGYAVAYNRRINFGKLILRELLKKMGTLATRSLVNKDVVCYYPRFIQLILDAILSDADQRNFAAGSRLTSCAKMKYLFITRMVSNERYPGVVSPLTPFMLARFNQPPLAENAFINEHGEVVITEQEQPQQVEEQMDQAEQPQEFEAELQEIPMEQVKVVTISDSPTPPSPSKRHIDVSWEKVVDTAAILGLKPPPLLVKRKYAEKVFERQKKGRFASPLKGSSTREPGSQRDPAATEDPVTQEPPTQSEGVGYAEGMVTQEPLSQRESADSEIPATQEPSSKSEDAGIIEVAKELPDNAQGVPDIEMDVEQILVDKAAHQEHIVDLDVVLDETNFGGSPQEPSTQRVEAASQPLAPQEPLIENTNEGPIPDDRVIPDGGVAAIPDPDQPIPVQPLSSRPLDNTVSETTTCRVSIQGARQERNGCIHCF